MTTAARSAHSAVAGIAAAGVASSLYLGWTVDTELPDGAGFSGGFSAGWEHVLNQPAYFTFTSAVLVLLTSAVLAVRPQIRSAVFHALRLAAVAQMVITGVVFNLLLRDDAVLTGVRLFNDTVMHQLLPVVVPVVWLAFGPRGRITGSVVAGSVVLPLVWLAVTLLRGPGLDWYPYVILDVPGMGYSGTGVYIVSILAGYVLLACLLWGLDRLLTPGRRRR